MDEFVNTLREWEIFYSTVALASATLAGLLFVSLSIRQDRMKEQSFRSLVKLARGSFGDFLYVLMLGLVFLVPHPEPLGLAIALFVLGGSRAIGLGRQISVLLRTRTRELESAHAFRGIILPSIASIGLIVVGIEVLRGVMISIYALVLVIAALLTRASWNAWLILVAEDDNLRAV
jgi:hypothetical protein